ncbi:MAG: PP2C family protein-serine/threonine phosphatase, partial [bacterium]
MSPANTVGGDYYDLIPLDETQIAVVMGDVSGKGMPAAMLMASLQGSLRTLISAGFRGRDLIKKLNSYLCENTPDNRLVTLFYGELNLSSGVLRYVNAGHNAPFWLQGADATQELASTTMALGIIEDPTINDNTIQLQPEDQILLFTDGLSEAFNKKLEAYGESRLNQSLLKHRDKSPSHLIRSLLEDVRRFSGTVKQGDDMTMMVVRRV